MFLSVGHDEYWSEQQRANVEAARGAGMHLAFFSGNEVFWKTRWENSISPGGATYRTLVSYKTTQGGQGSADPGQPWTGTWRDTAGTHNPENALTGQLFSVNSGNAALTVPQAFAALRFWRNTAVQTLPPGSSHTSTPGTIGYEWDEDVDNGFRPAGLIRLSSTTVNDITKLTDQGATYGPGSATHSATLYRHASGALVVRRRHGPVVMGSRLRHDRGVDAADPVLRQATVNLFTDMGVLPATLQSGLTASQLPADSLPPTTTLTSPASGAFIVSGGNIIVAGTATENGGGVVAGVEVSTDNGATWHRADGTGNWMYNWSAPTALGPVTIRTRAIDDSGNIETPSAGATVQVIATPNCPCNIWDATFVPQRIEISDATAIEVGVKFTTDISGFISGIRFYKGATNVGPHTGNLWTSTGTLVATAVFTNETASGWQQANFSSPVAVAPNTTYVASYHMTVGNYAVTSPYFGTTRSNAPLHAPSSASAGGNGVFKYGASGFPTETFGDSNYWVDVEFLATLPPDNTPPTVATVTPAAGATGVAANTAVTLTFSEALTPATVTPSTVALLGPGNAVVPASVTYNATTKTATLTPASQLALNTIYTGIAVGGSSDPRIQDVAGNAMTANYTWTFRTSTTPPPPIVCPCTVFDLDDAPSSFENGDTSPVELGMKFKSDVAGFITGIRFYKNSADVGGHIANLWTSSGTLLASAPFLSETAFGWQEVSFSTPVAVAANTTYVASYHLSAGRYAADQAGLLTSIDNKMLHALASETSWRHGLFVYGSSAIPDAELQREQLLGRSGLRPDGGPRHDGADGDFDHAGQRRARRRPAHVDRGRLR